MQSFRKNRGKQSTEPVEVKRGATLRDLPEPPKPEPKESDPLWTKETLVNLGIAELSLDPAPGPDMTALFINEGSWHASPPFTPARISVQDDVSAATVALRRQIEEAMGLSPEMLGQSVPASQTEQPRRGPTASELLAALDRQRDSGMTATQVAEQRPREIDRPTQTFGGPRTFANFGEAVERCRLEQQDWGAYVDRFNVGFGRHIPSPHLGSPRFEPDTIRSQFVTIDNQMTLDMRINASERAGNVYATACSAMIDHVVRQLLPEAVTRLDNQFMIQHWETSFILVPDGCPALVGRVRGPWENMMVVGINMRNMYVYQPVDDRERGRLRMGEQEQFETFLVRMMASAIPSLRRIVRR